jgi:PST family polysaccharide transporter
MTGRQITPGERHAVSRDPTKHLAHRSAAGAVGLAAAPVRRWSGRTRRGGRAPDAAPRRTSLGALANSGASALRLICQLGLLPILSRLIGPAEYGLVALAMPVLLLANVIADGGLVAALGRRRDASRTVESTAFWVTAGFGLALALGACAAAFPIGWALRQPRLPWLILALSPILLMNSLMAVFNGRIIRERRFGTFAIGDVMATAAGAATALLAATHSWGAWSLVAQQLALWVCKFVWITTRAGAQIGFVFRLAEVRDLLSFGANTLGATLADFISRNIDNMIIGGVLGAVPLGYYAMAYQLLRLPDMLILGPFWLYIFTATARVVRQGDQRAVQDLAVATLRLIATGLAPLFCGLALVSDLAVPLILGPKWTGAIGPLRFLAAAGFSFSLCTAMAALLMGRGKPALQFRLAVVLGLANIATVGAAAPFGVEAAAAALACGVAAVAVYYIDQLARDLGTTRAGLLRAFVPALAGCAALAVAVLLTRGLLREAPPVAMLAGAVLAGGAAYLTAIWIVAGAHLLADTRAFSRAHADSRADEDDAAGPEVAIRLAPDCRIDEGLAACD